MLEINMEVYHIHFKHDYLPVTPNINRREILVPTMKLDIE